MTDADLIRKIGLTEGWNHSNAWFQEQCAMPPYNRYVTSQNIQHVAGILSQRKFLDPELSLHKLGKQFMEKCKYDEPLAKRIIRNVLHDNRSDYG